MIQTLRRLGVFLLAAATVSVAQAAPVDTGHVKTEIVFAKTAIAPGETVQAGLSLNVADGWHIYWKNPGDAGQPTTLALNAPKDWTVSDLSWPTPKRLPYQTLMNYGYEGEVLQPFTVTAPKTASGSLTAKAEVDYLVCKDICIPETAMIDIALPVGSGGVASDAAGHIKAALDALPKPAPFASAAKLAAGRVTLSFALPAQDADGAQFFPNDAGQIVFDAAQKVEPAPHGFSLSTDADPALKALSGPVKGVLVLKDGRAFEISAAPGELAAATAPAPQPGPAPADSGGALGAPLAILFAFIGGLILNLMPCVFPVLSIKAAGLAAQAHTGHGARTHGLAFLAGTVATFIALGASLLLLRFGGEAVGWGFQLQNPGVTAALALLMLAIALNLAGLFEVGISLQNAGGSAPSGDGPLGAFATGALSVLVAAPCTAPFMAASLGYALTAPPLAAVLVFAALGLGLGAPFTLLTMSPALLQKLPRPGAWMEVFRQLLSFPMFGAAAWMIWVFSAQTGASGLALILSASVFGALALYLYGRAQTAWFGGDRAPLRLGGAVVSGALAVALTVAAAGASAPPADATAGKTGAAGVFSPEAYEAARAQGKLVFVDLTADWCVTCKVNERIALDTPKVQAAFKRLGVVYLVGDWTRRDAKIAAFLASHGRSGVPLYLVSGPGQPDAVILPQLLTPQTVIDALDKAAGPGAVRAKTP